MALGTLGSIVHGMAQPIGYLLLGKPSMRLEITSTTRMPWLKPSKRLFHLCGTWPSPHFQLEYLVAFLQVNCH
ncbi:hypothetical protein SLA2020_225460 [Shorea laevis]